jgi:ATP-binding cassette subfamily C protein LapB
MIKSNSTIEEHWFFGPVLKQRQYYIQVILASICINLFAIVSAFFIMTVYDRVIPNDAFETLGMLTVGMAIVIFFDFLMKMIRGSLTDQAGNNIDKDVADKIFNHISRNEKLIGTQSTGKIATTIKEFDLLKDVLASATFVTFADLPFTIIFLFVLYFLGGTIAAVPALIVIFVILVGILVQPLIKKSASNVQGNEQDKQSVLIEVLTGLETLKSLKGINLFRDRWMKSIEHQGKALKKSRFWGQISANLAQTGQQLSQVGVVVYGVILIHQSDMTMGSLIACVILSGRTLAPLGLISNLLGRINHAMIAYRNVGNLFTEQSSEIMKQQFLRHNNLKGSLELLNTGLTYENGKRPAVSPKTLIIKEGERVAIIGKMGSGKTSLLKLMGGLEKPTTGSIKLNGVDLSHLHPDDLRTHIGIMLQTPTVFSGSLKENLLMGKPDASDEELIEAAKYAGVDVIASELEHGYDTFLNERGQTLSGGQRQAICITRTIISNPSILLMDEPTSAMDTQSESHMLSKLDKWLQGRTFIVVTHRGLLLNLVNRVIVMDSGVIVADGPKEKVLLPPSQKGKNNA